MNTRQQTSIRPSVLLVSSALVMIIFIISVVDCRKNKGEDIIMLKGKLIMRGGKDEGNLILDTKSNDDSHSHSSQIIPVPVFMPHYQHHEPQMHHQPMVIQPIYLEDPNHHHEQHHEMIEHHHHEEPQHHHHLEHHHEEHHEPEHHHEDGYHHHSEPYHHEGSQHQLQHMASNGQGLTPQQQQQIMVEYQQAAAAANNMVSHQAVWPNMVDAASSVSPMASVVGIGGAFNPMWTGQASQLWPQMIRWQRRRK